MSARRTAAARRTGGLARRAAQDDPSAAAPLPCGRAGQGRLVKTSEIHRPGCSVCRAQVDTVYLAYRMVGARGGSDADTARSDSGGIPDHAGSRQHSAGWPGGYRGRVGGRPGSAARPVQPGRRHRICLEQTAGQAQEVLHIRGRQRSCDRYALGPVDPHPGGDQAGRLLRPHRAVLHRNRPAPPQGHCDAVQGPPARRPAAGTVFRPDGHHRSPFPYPDPHLQGVPGRRKVFGSWLSHSSASVTRPGSAARRTVVHDSLGWSQNLIKPSFLGAMFSNVPPRAIDGNFILDKLHWSAWARTSAHATGRIGWAQPEAGRQRHQPAGTGQGTGVRRRHSPRPAVLLPAGLQLYLAPPCVRRQGEVRRPVRQHRWLLDRPRHARRLGPARCRMPQSGVRTQNSLPSGSARTVHGTPPWPTSAGVALRARSRATSAAGSSPG